MPPNSAPPPTGKRAIEPVDYVPACVEACPTGAIRFGDLNDVPKARPPRPPKTATASGCSRKLGTEPKIYYRSKRDWVRQIAKRPRPAHVERRISRG